MNKQNPRSSFGVSRRDLITALRKLRRGDFTVRLPEDGLDEDGEIAMLFNEVMQDVEAGFRVGNASYQSRHRTGEK